jgi:hypothetical protein
MTGYTYKSGSMSFSGDRTIYLDLSTHPTSSGEENYALECSLPPGGALYSYYVEQAAN